MGRRQQHRFHGSPERFDVIAGFIYERYGNTINYIADVGGGQGMLTRILRKRYNYEAEVIDPRGWVLKNVRNRVVEFNASMAPYYDLIVGLHSDNATRAVAKSSLVRPTVLIPCCNFWSEKRLGRDELVQAIADFYQANQVKFETIVFPFIGPKNIGLVAQPPTH